jgi:hypothetical protein
MKKLATTMVFSLCLPCGTPQKRYENLSFCGLVQQPQTAGPKVGVHQQRLWDDTHDISIGW